VKKGLQQGHLEKAHEDILDILQARFESVSSSLVVAIHALEDLPQLKELLKKAATVRSLEEFYGALNGRTERTT
jgi:hypothetical protein